MKISRLDTLGDIRSFGETHKKAADIFAYLLHQEHVEPSQKAIFMGIVRDEDLPMVNMTKEFAYHFINNMTEEESNQLALLQKEDKSEFGIDNEALTDFVEMELVDAATSYRKWEYGKYAIGYFVEGFLPQELPNKLETKEINQNLLTERFAANLNLDRQEWEPFVHAFLIQALKYKMNPSSTNMAAYDLMGDVVHEKMVYLSIKINALKSNFKESLTKAIEQGRRRGPKR